MPLNDLQLFGPRISLQMFAVAASGQQTITIQQLISHQTFLPVILHTCSATYKHNTVTGYDP